MNNQSLRIVYAGTPDFATPALRALVKAGYDVVAVYTQPDRRAGRGRKLVHGPVKTAALDLQLPVLQPESFKTDEALADLKALQPDLMVVAAYGLILPQSVLDVPTHGCINIHASLLPRWRGAAPIHRAIEAGDAQTGVTIMQMQAGLDTGDMLLKKSIPIESDTRTAELHDALALLGADALLEVLDQLRANALTPEVQSEALVTYAHKLDKSEAVLDWTQPALQLHRKVCAFNPWPVAQTLFDGDLLRVWQSELVPQASDAAAGTVVSVAHGIDVSTGDGTLRLLQVQAPGKKAVAAHEFVNSRGVSPGQCLGE